MDPNHHPCDKFVSNGGCSTCMKPIIEQFKSLKPLWSSAVIGAPRFWNHHDPDYFPAIIDLLIDPDHIYHSLLLSTPRQTLECRIDNLSPGDLFLGLREDIVYVPKADKISVTHLWRIGASLVEVKDEIDGGKISIASGLPCRDSDAFCNRYIYMLDENHNRLSMKPLCDTLKPHYDQWERSCFGSILPVSTEVERCRRIRTRAEEARQLLLEMITTLPAPQDRPRTHDMPDVNAIPIELQKLMPERGKKAIEKAAEAAHEHNPKEKGYVDREAEMACREKILVSRERQAIQRYIAVQAKVEKLSAQQHELALLESRLVKQKANLKDNERDLASLEQDVKRRREMLHDEDRKLSQVEGNLETRRKSLENIEVGLKEAGRRSEILKSKEAQLTSLEQDLKRRHMMIDDKNAHLLKLEEDIKGSYRMVDIHKEEVSGMEEDIDRRRNDLDVEEDELANWEYEVDQRQRKLARKEADLERRRGILKDKVAELEGLDELEGEVTRRRQELEVKQATLAEEELEAEGREEALRFKKFALERIEKETKERDTALLLKEAELRMSEEEATQRELHLAHNKFVLRKQEDDMAELARMLSDEAKLPNENKSDGNLANMTKISANFARHEKLIMELTAKVAKLEAGDKHAEARNVSQEDRHYHLREHQAKADFMQASSAARNTQRDVPRIPITCKWAEVGDGDGEKKYRGDYVIEWGHGAGNGDGNEEDHGEEHGQEYGDSHSFLRGEGDFAGFYESSEEGGDRDSDMRAHFWRTPSPSEYSNNIE